MCGRYAATKDPATLAAEFDAVDDTGAEPPRVDYNVAPTKQVVTVVERHPRDDEGKPDESRTERSLRLMRWGLVPHWAKDAKVGNRMINTRAESAAEKPAFRSALAKRRCLVPADGWYEWKREGKQKQPFYMTTTDGSSIALAGIWATWRPKDAPEDEPPLITCSIITTDAVGQLAEIHDRMPLMLPNSAWQRWLDPDLADVSSLLTGPDEDLVAALDLRPVSASVNKVGNNGPELVKRVELDQDQPTLL
ncbi:MAG TPA: SOS response-associated peptidase [Pseudonocardiaceae bacterium]|nr:SOS response-associated peptidase [Pseudonocardiaceae bacterium]